MSKEQIERLKTTGRNDPCPCGSGKKYKKCHMLEDEAAQHKMMKKLAEEREAVLKADAEKEGDETAEGTGDAKSKKAGEPGFNRADTHTHSAQNKPSNLPRRGAI